MSDTKEIITKRGFRSLSGTITAGFLTVSLVVLLLSTCLELYISFRTQQKVISDEQQLVAKDAASTVSGFVQEKFRILRQAATLNDLATTSGNRELIMYKLLGMDQSFRQLFLIDATGKRLDAASRLSVLTPDPLPSRQDQLLAKIRKGETYISPIYIDPTTNEPLVLAAVPSTDLYGNVQAAFIAEVNLKFMWDLVANIKVGQSGQAFVVDRQGNLIAYGDTSRVLSRENETALPEVQRFVGQDSTAVMKPNPTISKGIQGTYVVSSHASLGTPDWVVVVEVPVLEAYAALIQEFSFALLVIVVSAIFAAVYGRYLSRRITKPIKDLSAAADSISHGNLGGRTDASAANELGQLATSFNSMASKLQELYGSMDQKIKDKTSELTQQVGEGEKSKSAILNLLEDIDEEKKKVEQTVVERTKQLNEEKARLLASINSLSFGFVLADSEDHIVLKNPALQKILDTSVEVHSVHDITELLKSPNAKVDLDIGSSCKRCMELKEPVEFKEVPYGKKFLRIICTPIIAEGSVIGYIFLVEDITEAKVMERSRDEFFAVASHELRTPLTAIRGNADMLLDMYKEKVDKDMKEMLEDIDASSVRLINVVNDFLEVSRLEQGRIEIKKETFAITDVLEKVMRDLKEMIEKKGLAFTYTPPQEALPMAFADKNRIEQIIVNLMGNAIKFTKQGTITMSVQKEGAMLKVRVTDSGTGISEQNQNLLFRKFQQAGEQMLARDVSQSTGLGLYICRLILNTMGGEIGLEKSELGKGSTFYFTVPTV